MHTTYIAKCERREQRVRICKQATKTHSSSAYVVRVCGCGRGQQGSGSNLCKIPKAINDFVIEEGMGFKIEVVRYTGVGESVR